jgi:hypothetical protein
MTNVALRQAAATLDQVASMLDLEHAAIAQRVRRARDELVDDPGSDLPDSTIRRLRRLMTGTMGSMSDVAFGTLVDGRWVVDGEKERRYQNLSRELEDQLARLPPSRPPDLYLVTDRVREGWLMDLGNTEPGLRRVEVQPPIWTGSTTTSEVVDLRGVIGDGDEVEISVEQSPGSSTEAPADRKPVLDLGLGRVFATREAAEAAKPKL